MPFHLQRRVTQACRPCRKQKIKCDGVRPNCGTCKRRREYCAYVDVLEQPMKRNHVLLENKGYQNLFEISAMVSSAPGSLMESAPTSALNDNSSGVTAMGLVSRSPKGDYRTGIEYFGNSSAIGFIQQLQNTLRLDPTSKPGERGREEGTPRERSVPESPLLGSSMGSLPPQSLADHLVACYFTKIHTLYPFIHKTAFMAAYKSLWSREGPMSSSQGLGLGDVNVNHTTFYFGLNAVFALGCQFSDMVQVDREVTSEVFFQRCKPALDLNYLEACDLALCQTMLLMVHYLQGSMTPNRSWHVIGIACRSAQALGLHSSVGDRHRSFAEIQIRRRVWHGCVMLDLAASTILGRPVMISQKPVTPRPEAIDDIYLKVDDPSSQQSPSVFSHVSWFVETLKLHEILRKILLTLYDNAALIEHERTEDHWKTRGVPDIRTIAKIDAELQNFTDGLPDVLNWDAPIQNDGNESFLRERLLLKARFSYLKLLLYRPVLSQMLRDNKSPENHQGNHHRGIYAKYSLDCSVYCAMAAMDLVDLVHRTCTTELSSVWFYNLFYTFTAGSVILLAELSPPIVNTVTKQAIDESWQKCFACFNHLKSYNIVAERCSRSISTIRSKCLATVSEQHGDALSTMNRPLSQHQNTEGMPQGRMEMGTEMPFSEDLFGDLRFDDDTFLDSYWFDLQS